MVKKIFIVLSLIAGLLSFTVPILAQNRPSSTLEEALIINETASNVKIRLLGKNDQGKEVTIEKNQYPLAYSLSYKTGDRVIVTVSKTPNGKTDYYISDVDRKPALLLLMTVFILLVILVTRLQGVTSLLGMVFSFYVIQQMIIPNIIAGTDPIVSTFLGAILIIPVTYYLAHGFNKKTNVAIFGTFITLLLTTALAYGFTILTKLTGFASEEASFLQTSLATNQINIKSLLLAGIVIGALAVLNDITISQASIVESLRQSNKNLSFWELYNHAMKVGRDHIGSLVNTLILVYIGASFPLVILFYNNPIPFGLVANQEIIATEIVRTLVTSIGIIAAVPITTYLSCLLIKN
ncbi:YibE/F family protein [Patescibacteria group bacterium]|nr:YibE/F family protein [Patescibacteria group bacterium]